MRELEGQQRGLWGSHVSFVRAPEGGSQAGKTGRVKEEAEEEWITPPNRLACRGNHGDRELWPSCLSLSTSPALTEEVHSPTTLAVTAMSSSPGRKAGEEGRPKERKMKGGRLLSLHFLGFTVWIAYEMCLYLTHKGRTLVSILMVWRRMWGVIFGSSSLTHTSRQAKPSTPNCQTKEVGGGVNEHQLT